VLGMVLVVVPGQFDVEGGREEKVPKTQSVIRNYDGLQVIRHVGITLPNEAKFVRFGGLAVHIISYATLAMVCLKVPTVIVFSSRRIDTLK
jgi:hypothetical protein